MSSVAVEQITKVFQGEDGCCTRAVDNVSFATSENEFLVLLGPSGCGKTTILRLIAGLEEPTSGAVLLDGRDATRMPPGERNVAMVFQNHALYPHMTAYENMAFGLRVRRVPGNEIRERVLGMARSLGLEDCLKRKPADLSGGQRQRVALGRALVRRPEVLLMDEPLSQLDAPLRAQLRQEVLRLHQAAGFTALYVTHDQSEAVTLGHRIAVLDHGKLQQMGPPQELLQRPVNEFVARFLAFASRTEPPFRQENTSTS